jgi:hypothetical protein
MDRGGLCLRGRFMDISLVYRCLGGFVKKEDYVEKWLIFLSKGGDFYIMPLFIKVSI